MDHLISMYIDDELDLNGKIIFIERIHDDRSFKDESVDLLKQEKLLRSDVVDFTPEITIEEKPRSVSGWFRPMRPIMAVAAGILIFVFLQMYPRETEIVSHRFVIYHPEVSSAEITGSFTAWKTIPMIRAGASGYWEITLSLPKGEHRFSYILEGEKRVPDPTVLTRERDDFGGENSIIHLQA
jgi:hypothetical protein